MTQTTTYISPLRWPLRKRILGLLDLNYFGRHSFEINFDQLSKQYMYVEIRFRPDSRYFFQIVQPFPSGPFMTVEAPGNALATEEEISHQDLDSAVIQITSWTTRIEEDVRGPIIDSGNADIENFINQMLGQMANPHSRFDSEEIESLKHRLDVILEDLKELEKKSALTGERLRKAEQDIVKLKEDLKVMTKATWSTVAASKLFDVLIRLGTSEKALSLFFDDTKRLGQ